MSSFQAIVVAVVVAAVAGTEIRESLVTPVKVEVEEDGQRQTDGVTVVEIPDGKSLDLGEATLMIVGVVVPGEARGMEYIYRPLAPGLIIYIISAHERGAEVFKI